VFTRSVSLYTWDMRQSSNRIIHRLLFLRRKPHCCWVCVAEELARTISNHALSLAFVRAPVARKLLPSLDRGTPPQMQQRKLLPLVCAAQTRPIAPTNGGSGIALSYLQMGARDTRRNSISLLLKKASAQNSRLNSLSLRCRRFLFYGWFCGCWSLGCGC
jgi:hypothetical protein